MFNVVLMIIVLTDINYYVSKGYYIH
jgi:hypothetical protein